jgi:hypothetical protein
MVALLRRAIDMRPENRFRDAIEMNNAFGRIQRRALRKPRGSR